MSVVATGAASAHAKADRSESVHSSIRGQVELGTTDAHRGEHGAAARGVHEAGLDADWSSSEWNLWCRVVGRRSNSWIQSEQARCRGCGARRRIDAEEASERIRKHAKRGAVDRGV